MAVTIGQIADAAGVSRGTVDRVLHNRGRVNQDVARRVRRTADELGYVLQPRNKSSGKRRDIKIGVITQLSDAPFMMAVKQGIYDGKAKLEHRGIKVLIREIAAVDEEELLEAMNELAGQRICGLAVMPADTSPVRLKINQFINALNIPVITFNSDITGTGRSCFVGLDNRQSGRAAAGLMAMLTGGKGDILVITGFFSNHVNNTRVDGFMEEMKRAFPGVRIIGVNGSFDDADEVQKIIKRTLEAYPDLAGILVVSSGQAGIERGLESSRKRPYIIAYDLTSQTAELLKNGIIDFIIDQEGYVQGAQSLEILADMVQLGYEPETEMVYCEINIKTKYNI